MRDLIAEVLAAPRKAANLPKKWTSRLERLDHAFQPIVNVHTGSCYGYEALLRGVAEAGFASIQAVFDDALADGVLAAVEEALWARAIAKFARLPHHGTVKLFCNADSRGALTDPDAHERISERLRSLGLHPSALCLEISERHAAAGEWASSGVLDGLQRAGFRLAVDDFGRGFSGLELLYSCPSDFLKIDRFFIAGIERDRAKRVLTETMIKLAHVLGRFVVAEGVETDAEFFVCRELGCDLVQGYLVQRPTEALDDLAERYDVISALVERDRRRRADAADSIAAQLELVPTVTSEANLHDVIRQFGTMQNRTFLVVVDPDQRPTGLVREQALKGYLYNPYGRDLLANASIRSRVSGIVSRCPIVDIYAPVEDIINAYAEDQGNEGVIVIRDMKYAGFIDSRRLLALVSERNLANARDQNPLTRLPGNRLIYEFVSRALNEVEAPYALAYFDFDNFKPFNDKFGFRQGDRALILFSESLAKGLLGEQRFVGHIGGDDFFAGAREMPFDQFCQRIRSLLAKFSTDIESFYDAESRAKRRIVGADRDGGSKIFPLMRVSAVVLDLRPGRMAGSLDYVSALIAEGKSIAKRSDEGLHVMTVGGDCSPAEGIVPVGAPMRRPLIDPVPSIAAA